MNHARVWTEEAIDENKRLRARASWIGSMRIFNRKAWLVREKPILKYPAWNCVRIEEIDWNWIPFDSVLEIEIYIVNSTWGCGCCFSLSSIPTFVTRFF